MILELFKSHDGYCLNHWDSEYGEDICCEIVDGKIFLSEWGEDDEHIIKEISIEEFLKLADNILNRKRDHEES